MAPGSHPPFDPELQTVLDALAGQLPVLTGPDVVPLIRNSIAAFSPSDEDMRRSGRIEIAERHIPGPEGAPDLSLLICSPAGASTSGAGVYHIHGGGMVAGDNRTGIGGLLDWVEEFGAVVVSVDYRLAPEHPHPAPVDDCYAGLVWTAAHADELGIDGRRLLLAGASAGGGLAAAVALMARDLGGPPLIGQVLMCPMLDDRNQTPSSHELDGEGIWDRQSNLTGWKALLGAAQGSAQVDDYAAPGRADNLAGLPPAFIDVGSVETFRDEDVAYATRIWQAGGVAELHVWPGGFHGFDLVAPDAALSRAARDVRTGWVRRLLEPPAGAGDVVPRSQIGASPAATTDS